MSNLILLSEFKKTEVELWKPVDGVAGYDISNLGRVRTWLGKKRGSGQRGGFIKAQLDSPRLLKISGTYTTEKYRHHYPTVGLRVGQKQKTFPVHTLVARAFLRRSPDLNQVNHKTGIKTDPRVDNLEWTNNQRNHQHAAMHGLHARGEGHGNVRITERDVRRIRKRAMEGDSFTLIAKDYGYTVTAISMIVRRINWGWLT